MRAALITMTMLALFSYGCSAINSLIVHPIQVLHQQHEYNEAAEELAKEPGPGDWPK